MQDNTCRENKNNICMKWCGLCCSLGLIKEVEQQYLISGHTHEDIDQLFGWLAKFLLRQHKLSTPDDFVKAGKFPGPQQGPTDTI
jgi:hypothetical protein